MRDLGIRGVVRGKAQKTTRPDKALPCPRDKVNRQFRAPAPNMLWVFLVQMRPDFVAAENKTGTELARALRDFRSQLSIVTRELKGFSVGTVQHAKDDWPRASSSIVD